MKRILVIEDMRSLREEIIEIVECLDFDVIGAENGLVGVELATLHSPDLILCDVMMPELDGYGVLAALRQNPETAKIPFIFLSAKADRPDIRQGMNLGADDYLTKPFTTDELSEAISARLQKQATIASSYSDEIQKKIEQLSAIAYREPLTQLPNRSLLYYRLQEAIKQAKHTQTSVAILCLNVLGFKLINTTLGYSTGDLLLQAIAKRLTDCVQPDNTVARTSGDEFSIILVNSDRKQDIENFAEVIINTLSKPYNLNGNEFCIQLCVGITIYPEDNSSSEKLLNHADTAMRYAKERSTSNYQFYSHQIDELANERELLGHALSSALERSEFQIYYQPQVNLITGKIVGTEALLRWNQPELGFISPARFIPLAEETGLIIPIGEWVLRNTCRQALTWQKNHLLPIQVSVNLSGRQFKQPNLIETISSVLKETGLDPNLLDLELTETSVIEDVEVTIATFHKLKNMGISISIDDFGTGYSALNYLKRFPIDTLKIDQSFVRDITTDSHNAAISKAIIAMAHSLQLKVIAEGVETQEQLNFLRQHSCDAIQGYFFSPPVPATEFEKMLSDNKHLRNL